MTELKNKEKDINLTDSAASAVNEMMVTQTGKMYLRVYLSQNDGGSTQYGLALDESVEQNDVVIEDKGVEMRIDPVSLKYMLGSTIDFISNDMGGGFKIENPNSRGGCGGGCGNNLQAAGAPSESCGSCNSCSQE